MPGIAGGQIEVCEAIRGSSMLHQQEAQPHPDEEIPNIFLTPQPRNHYDTTYFYLIKLTRKREEARALQNLRRKFQAVRVLQANRAEPVEASSCANNNLNPEELDNRPYLLKKILTNRPVSMVLDMSEIQTAWQDSDFITDCLCWHNVYRQRHAAPPLTMSSEKGQEVATYWYSAVRQYDYSGEPDSLHVNVNAGHFTQMVWVGTRYCGVGKARGRSGKLVVVAHYMPPGNVSGAYMINVLPPCEDYPRLPPPPPPRLIMTGSVTPESSSNSPPST
uniref:Cysteine-rich venom protein kaouthin-2-like n=1 Tax=Diabrotica virgifera virgifera TaxID=50390 RepID=A0A6P7FKG2_DIAVI